jgi:hypothetical protein
MILATHGIVGSQIVQSFDTDAQAFFDRVTTAGGNLSSTEKNAVNTLVIQMKNYGIWTKMKAIYPMVGASAAACAQNLKSSSFTGTFNGGWTFASTGVTPNGSTGYFDTGLNTTTHLSYLSASFSVYIRTESMGSNFVVDMGNSTNTYSPITNIEVNTDGTSRNQYCWDFTANRGLATINTTNSRGMWGTSRTASSTWVSFERNTAVGKTTSSTNTSLPNFNTYIGATNFSGTAAQFSSKQNAFAHIGDGLTTVEFNNLYSAVQLMQLNLNRNV